MCPLRCKSSHVLSLVWIFCISTLCSADSLINIMIKGTKHFPHYFTVFIFRLTVSSRPPLLSFLESVHFPFWKQTRQGKTYYQPYPCLADSSVCFIFCLFIFPFVITELLTRAEREKGASADSNWSIFCKTEQNQISCNPCALKAQNPKFVTHFKLNRLALPILFTPGQDILKDPLWEYD